MANKLTNGEQVIETTTLQLASVSNYQSQKLDNLAIAGRTYCWLRLLFQEASCNQEGTILHIFGADRRKIGTVHCISVLDIACFPVCFFGTFLDCMLCDPDLRLTLLAAFGIRGSLAEANHWMHQSQC